MSSCLTLHRASAWHPAGPSAAERRWLSWAGRRHTRSLGAHRPGIGCLARLDPLRSAARVPAVRCAAPLPEITHPTLMLPPPPLLRRLPACSPSQQLMFAFSLAHRLLPEVERIVGLHQEEVGGELCGVGARVGARLGRLVGASASMSLGSAWAPLSAVCERATEPCAHPPCRRERPRVTWQRCSRSASGSSMTARARRTLVRWLACPALLCPPLC